MKIKSRRFGDLEFEEDKLIHFPLGLMGFETQHRYILLDSDDAAPMRWLQSVDEPALAFLVVEPTMFFPDFKLGLNSDDHNILGMAHPQEEVSVACLVVIPQNPALMTINLMGPLVINPIKRVGKQVVLHDSGYSTRQRLLPDPAESTETAALV